jgi:hypothetical protein
MTRGERESDQLFPGSAQNEGHPLCRATRPPLSVAGRPAAAGAPAPWLAGGVLQAVWPAGLPLHRRSWPRAQALSVGQHHRRAAAHDVCPAGGAPGSGRIPRQFPRCARGPQRDLRDQCRTAAPPRGHWVTNHGLSTSSGYCRPRFRQGGRHHRQYDRILSCRRRPAIRSGGTR